MLCFSCITLTIFTITDLHFTIILLSYHLILSHEQYFLSFPLFSHFPAFIFTITLLFCRSLPFKPSFLLLWSTHIKYFLHHASPRPLYRIFCVSALSLWLSSSSFSNPFQQYFYALATLFLTLLYVALLRDRGEARWGEPCLRESNITWILCWTFSEQHFFFRCHVLFPLCS